MKLWLDDIRKPDFGFDLWAKTYEQCVELLAKYKDKIEIVSLDHDLAPEHYVNESVNYFDASNQPNESVNKTGYRILEWFKENNWWPEQLIIHTLSEFGRGRMKAYCREHAPKDGSCCVVVDPCRRF